MREKDELVLGKDEVEKGAKDEVANTVVLATSVRLTVKGQVVDAVVISLGLPEAAVKETPSTISSRILHYYCSRLHHMATLSE